MNIETLVVTDFQQNCRIITQADKALIIDPGGEAKRIIEYLTTHALSLEGIFLTHSHIDHCAGVAPLVSKYPEVPLYGHAGEDFFRKNITQQCDLYGLNPQHYHNCPEPTHYLQGGEKLNLLGLDANIVATPGHSPGHLALYFPGQHPIVFSGDCLFYGSIGRTDLPMGDMQTLLSSIREQLLTLPPETIVAAGHGPNTTIAREIRENPFLS